MKLQNALICLPDISGFTRFMSNTKIDLSHKVIPALLNEIIYANDLKLKVSEIEGDAVLFYRVGEPPTLGELINQCQAFYQNFYQQIAKLLIQHQRSQDSDNIVEILGLKIIMHYGQVDLNKIGKRIKLIGEDVIIAHSLLKNSIPESEYVLFSENLLKLYDLDVNEGIPGYPFVAGSDQYSHLGDQHYKYMVMRPSF